MENSLIFEDDSIFTKEINGNKCLHYKFNHNNQNIIKDIRFQKWLKEEIDKKGKTYNLMFCKNSNFFLYFKNPREQHSFNCCDKKLLQLTCQFCGKFFYIESYCCTKCGIMGSFSLLLLNGQYFFSKNSFWESR